MCSAPSASASLGGCWLVIGLATPCAAQDSTVAFRDLPIGSSEAAMQAKFPTLECSNYPQDNEMLLIVVADRSCGPGESEPAGTWAGAHPESYRLYFYRDRLSLVRIVIPSAEFPGVIETITARYGPPTTRAGRAYRWERDTGAITAGDRGREADILLSLRSWEDTTAAVRARIRKAAADDM